MEKYKKLSKLNKGVLKQREEVQEAYSYLRLDQLFFNKFYEPRVRRSIKKSLVTWDDRLALHKKKLRKIKNRKKKMIYWNNYSKGVNYTGVPRRVYILPAKTRSLRKNLRFRHDFFKREVLQKSTLELRSIIFKYFMTNGGTKELRYFFFYMFKRWLKWSWSHSMYNNRCLLTYRVKGVFRLVRMSRICVKVLTNTDYLTGIKRSVR